MVLSLAVRLNTNLGTPKFFYVKSINAYAVVCKKPSKMNLAPDSLAYVS